MADGDCGFVWYIDGSISQCSARDCEFNLIAFLAIMAVTTILIIGIKESANFNTGIGLREIGGGTDVIAVALPFVLKHPALAMTTGKCFCRRTAGRSGFGWSGVARGASVVFLPTSIRRCFHRSSGSQESAEGHAHRHSWLARGLHDPLHRGSDY